MLCPSRPSLAECGDGSEPSKCNKEEPECRTTLPELPTSEPPLERALGTGRWWAAASTSLLQP